MISLDNIPAAEFTYANVDRVYELRASVRRITAGCQRSCHSPVDELTLSASILDDNSHMPLLKGSPAQNNKQKALNSTNTAIPCVNADETRY